MSLRPMTEDALIGRYEIEERLPQLAGEFETPLFVCKSPRSADRFFVCRCAKRPDEATEALFRQSQRIAALGEPAFLPLHDHGVLPGGECFLAWPYEPGRNLRQRLSKSALTIEEAVDLAQAIARGLSGLHAADIVHGHLRPANLWIARSGKVRLLASGLANPALAVESPQLFSDSQWAAAAYRAPEQLTETEEPVHAKAIAQITPACDLWTVGILLFEMVTAELPFRGRTFAALSKAIRSHPPEPIGIVPGAVPEELEWIIDRTVTQKPSDRYATAVELLQDLASLGRRLHPRPVPRKPSSTPQSRIAEPQWRGLLEELNERRQRAATEAPLSWWELTRFPLLLLLLMAAAVLLWWTYR